MEEDYKTATRYSYETKDMYDPESNTLDIRSNGLYPSNVLSNLCSNGFRFEGMVCGSMEGFLQSLKRKELDKQRQICSMKGGNARKMSVSSWQTDQIVWWKGRAIDRQSADFQSLLRRAYQAMFEQNERFRAALMQTRGITLVHSSGESSPFKTILTPAEFCGILTAMRDSYDQRDKAEELKQKSVHRKRLLYLHAFGSSAANEVVQELCVLLPDFDIVAPDLPVDPAEVLPFLKGVCINELPDLIVGTGMGGMYALLLRGYKRICINPVFGMSQDRRTLKAGSFEYCHSRKNGSTHFEITQEIINHYAELEAILFKDITDGDRNLVWGVFADDGRQQTNDKTLFLKYYNNIIPFDGECDGSEKMIRSVLVPLIYKSTADEEADN